MQRFLPLKIYTVVDAYAGGFSIGHSLKVPMLQLDPLFAAKWQSLAGVKKHSVRHWLVL